MYLAFATGMNDARMDQILALTARALENLQVLRLNRGQDNLAVFQKEEARIVNEIDGYVEEYRGLARLNYPEST